MKRSLAVCAAVLAGLTFHARAGAQSISCSTSGSTLSVIVTGTSLDSVLVTTNSGAYGITFDGSNAVPSACTGVSDTSYPNISVTSPGPVTFQPGSTDFGLNFIATASTGPNTLNLAAIGTSAQVQAGSGGVGAVTVGTRANAFTFSGINAIGGAGAPGGSTTLQVTSAGTNFSLSYTGAGPSNTLDFSAVGSNVSVNETFGGGTASFIPDGTVTFAGVQTVVGSILGGNFFLVGAGNMNFVGMGSSNTLSFAEDNPGITFDTGAGTVMTANGQDTFQDIQVFVGSSSGTNTFVTGAAPAPGAPPSSGFRFQGGGSGNTLSFAEVPLGSGVQVFLDNRPQTANIGNGTDTFTGIQTIIGSPNPNTFYPDLSSMANYTIQAGNPADTINYSNAGAGITSSVSGGNVSVTGGFGSTTTLVGAISVIGSNAGGNTFAAPPGSGYDFAAAGSSNTLDLSAISANAQVQVGAGGAGTVIIGGGSDSFSGVSQILGSNSGSTDFVPSGPVSTTLVGQGSNNKLDLSTLPAASATPLLVDIGKGTVTVPSNPPNPPVVESFSGLQSFVGSLEGNTTFVTGAVGGSSFMGQGSGNTLSFAEVPSPGVGVLVFLSPNGQGQEVAQPGSGSDTFAGITSIIGSPNNDTFNAGPGNYTLVGHSGDTLSYALAPSGITLSFNNGNPTVTGGYSGTTTAAGITTFIGSSAGNNTFIAAPTGGYTFSAPAGSAGNVLNLSATPPGATVVFNSGGTSGTLQGLGGGVGGSTVDSFTNINGLTQTATFTSTPPAHALVGGMYSVSATASSGLPVAFSIDATSSAGACSISGATVLFTGPGSCVIDAKQAGNGSYLPAGAQQSVLVSVTTQTITFASTPPAPAVVGGTYAVAASASSGLPVTFAIDGTSTPGACTLGGSKVAFAGTGNCVIDANQAGNGSYLPATAKQTVVVTLPHTAAAISTLTFNYVQSSAAYQAASAAKKAFVLVEVTVITTALKLVSPHLTHAQNAALINLYKSGVAQLVAGGYLTPAEAALLTAAASGLQ